jgi:hypothetical protein
MRILIFRKAMQGALRQRKLESNQTLAWAAVISNFYSDEGMFALVPVAAIKKQIGIVFVD